MFEVGKDIIKNWGGMSSAVDKSGRARMRFIYGVLVTLFIIFIIRTFWLGVEGTSRARISNGAGEWVSSRADIVDRNGDILAKNIMSGNIVLRANLVTDPDAVANEIHKVIPEISVADALYQIKTGRRFIYLQKLANDQQRAEIKSAKLPGLEIEDMEWRRYPKRRLTSHVVGFMGADSRGLEGIERTRDEYLRENKDPLVLSIDSRIQSAIYQELSAAMEKYSAHAAMGMLMNSKTGEMIAMVSLPDYDPENLDADPKSNRMFYPMRGIYEIGSIFKIFNTAMAAEEGIGFNKEYYIAEPFKIYNKSGRVAATINDVASFKPPRPNLSVAEIMLHSCNVGSAQIALDLPEGTQQEFFNRIHMSQALDLEFGHTERSLMPIKWGPVEKATVSFGHGISVTPMHVLLAVNAMTNGGIYVWPTLNKRVVGEIKGQRVISPEISSRLREIMFGIAETTTGRAARIAGINIGGKTATAEKRINGKIDRKRNLTSFVAVFPIESPQYILLIMLDEPQGTKESWGLRTAAWNAVPTTGKILDAILPLLSL